MTTLCDIRQFLGEDHHPLDALFRRFKELTHSDPASAGLFFAEFKAGLERHIEGEP